MHPVSWLLSLREHLLDFTKYRGFVCCVVCLEDSGYLNKSGMSSLVCRYSSIDSLNWQQNMVLWWPSKWKSHSPEKADLNYFHHHSRERCIGLEHTMTCWNEWLKAGSHSAYFQACEVTGWKQRKKAVSSQYSCCTLLGEVSSCFFSSSKSVLTSGPMAAN